VTRTPRSWLASWRVALFATSAWLPVAAGAEETRDLDELLAESIVSTPSRSQETATTAPATSSIVTAEDLRRYGVRSLDEAINFISLGMVTSSPLHAVEIGARGVLLTSDYGNHVLLLLDGHVLNEAWNGSAYFDRGLAVPLELVDHIEIILGPGSVLYGSQAMLGVIHVVTRRAAARRGLTVIAETELGFPSHRSGALIAPSLSDSYLERLGLGYRLAASFGREFELAGAAGELLAGLEYYRQDGPSFELGPQAYGADAVSGAPKNFGPRARPGVWGGVTHHAYYTEAPAAYLRVTLGDVYLAARAAAYRRATPYLGGNVNLSGDFDAAKNREKDRWLNFEVGYRRTLTELVDVSLRAYADAYDYHWTDASSAAEDCSGGAPLGCTQRLFGESKTLGSEAQVHFSGWPELRIETLVGIDARLRMIGSDYESIDRSTNAGLVGGNEHSRSDVAFAMYAQQSASLTRWLDLNVGARFDYDERSGSALSPRSALGVTPWQGGRLKLIYSEAFRAPSAYELGYADYTTQIPPEHLRAENVRSVEGSVEQHFGAQRLLFGVFRSWWSNMVSYAVLDETQLAAAQAAGLLDPSISEAYVYVNIARIDNYGLNGSFEGSMLEHRLRYGLNVTQSFSRNDPRDGSEPGRLTVGPSLFGNARASYELQRPWPTLAVAVAYQRRRLADRALDGGFSSVPTAPPHVELGLTASGDLTIAPGLRYRLGTKLAFSRVSPYVIGPWQSAVDESTPYELAPLRRLQAFVGLEYSLDP
jgi:outer membrane receptor for ferrienterochelin and colicins